MRWCGGAGGGEEWQPGLSPSYWDILGPLNRGTGQISQVARVWLTTRSHPETVTDHQSAQWAPLTAEVASLLALCSTVLVLGPHAYCHRWLLSLCCSTSSLCSELAPTHDFSLFLDFCLIMASVFCFFSLCLRFPQERDIVNKPMTVSLLGMVIRHSWSLA